MGDRGAASGGEDGPPEVQSAETEEEGIEIERGSEIGIETANEIGKGRGKEKEGLDVQEGRLRKGRSV